MRPAGWAAMIALCLVTAGAWGSQVYFSSDQNVEHPIIETINRTNRSIQVALYEINSPTLVQALQRAAHRGVRVQVILQRGGRSVGLSTPFNSVETRWLGGRSPRGLMHHKFAVFDDERVETGSYNWTQGARHANYENALFEDDSAVVRAYMQQFEFLWKRSRSVDSPAAASRSTTHRSAARRHRSLRIRVRQGIT